MSCTTLSPMDEKEKKMAKLQGVRVEESIVSIIEKMAEVEKTSTAYQVRKLIRMALKNKEFDGQSLIALENIEEGIEQRMEKRIADLEAKIEKISEEKTRDSPKKKVKSGA